MLNICFDRLGRSIHFGVNPEILKSRIVSGVIDIQCYKKNTHFWNGNESESPVLLSNFSKDVTC